MYFDYFDLMSFTIMESCENSAWLIFHKIRCSRCKEMVTTNHALSEWVLRKVHTNSGHTCNSHAPFKHKVSPFFWDFLEVREICRDNFRRVKLSASVGRFFSNSVEVSPFSIIWRRLRGDSNIFLCVVADNIKMRSSSFLVRRSSARLVSPFR